MKRTRRIEITRYRRTVTVTQDEVPADPAIDVSAIHFIANEWEVPPPGAKDGANGVVRVVLSDEPPSLRRWLSFNFREWLRRRL
jgi:hypothetical protein